MKKMVSAPQVCVGVVFCFLTSIPVFGADYTSVIQQRQQLCKSNRQAQKAIKNAVSEKDLSTVEKRANELAYYFLQLANADLFPRGSDYKESRARSLVWEKRDEFVAKAKNSAAIAKEIAAQANAGRMEQVRASVSSLGKRTCTDCHQTFRKPVKRKGM